MPPAATEAGKGRRQADGSRSTLGLPPSARALSSSRKETGAPLGSGLQPPATGRKQHGATRPRPALPPQSLAACMEAFAVDVCAREGLLLTVASDCAARRDGVPGRAEGHPSLAGTV